MRRPVLSQTRLKETLVKPTPQLRTMRDTSELFHFAEPPRPD